MIHIVEREDETLDYIANKYYGSSFGYLEILLDSNVLLYESDIYLQKGLKIILPNNKRQYKERINLW